MMNPIEVLLLSREDVSGLGLTPHEVIEVVEKTMVEHADGAYEMHPKIGVHPTGTDPDNFIHAMPAYLPRFGVCGLKWVGGFAKNPSVGLPNVTGVQICNDVDTGIPLAIMDCAHLTGLRTAAVSATVAKQCARGDSESLALCGCGFQGNLHLDFFLPILPTLKQIRLFDARPAAAEALATRIQAKFDGSVTVCSEPGSCLDGADVIVTCTTGDEQIIEPQWFAEGTFGVGIEGGCAYTAEALHQADKFIVDDIPLAEYFQKISLGRKNDRGEENPEFPGGIPPIHATIGQIVAGKKPGRESERERIIAIPIGMAICDIALGDLVLRRARERGVGTVFPLA